jgi:hypothetical protein
MYQQWTILVKHPLKCLPHYSWSGNGQRVARRDQAGVCKGAARTNVIPFDESDASTFFCKEIGCAHSYDTCTDHSYIYRFRHIVRTTGELLISAFTMFGSLTV